MTGAALALATLLGFTAPYSAAEVKEVETRLEECEVWESCSTAYIWTGNPCANGEYPSTGEIGTCASNTLDFGDIIYVEDMGIYEVKDTGNILNNGIDLYMDSYDEAIQYGVQYKEITLLYDIS